MAAAPAQAALVLCGIVDQGAGDTDATLGIVAATCVTAGGGSFTGSAEETNLNNFDLIRVRGLLRGAGKFEVENNYNVGPWLGNGGMLVSAAGRFGAPIIGTEFLMVSATASTFSNNPVTATPVIKATFFDQNVAPGKFTGQGTLTATIEWNAGIGVLDLRNTGDFMIAVPEPSAWAMLLLGFGGLGAVLRRRRALAA